VRLEMETTISLASCGKGELVKPIRLCCLSLMLVAILPLTADAQTLTAADAILRIQRHYAATLPSDTVDTIKAGDPSTRVAGIAVTFLATLRATLSTI